MRKVILFNMVSVDGLFEGPNRDINWHTVDEEFNQFAIKQLDEADGLIFGRVTYELMASYWPTTAAAEDDPAVAERMNALPKIVFSKTLQAAGWQNTRLVSEDTAGEVTRLKQQPGADLLIFGSGCLAGYLTRHGLIDEYRLMVAPLVLGSGTPLFQGVHGPQSLKLLNTRAFGNGNVLLSYQPA